MAYYEYDKKSGLLKVLDGKPVRYVQSPHKDAYSGQAISIVTMHFTGSGGVGGDGDAHWFSDPTAKVSAHFILGRDGGVIQCVPLTKKAWHAGTSFWAGKNNVNDRSFGIEMDNWGLLTVGGDKKYRSYTGEVIDPKIVELHDKKPWEAYTAAQYATLSSLLKFMRAEFPSLRELVGHSDIAPGRKVDPGPAFRMNVARNAFEGRGDVQAVDLVHRVSSSGLNLRKFPDALADNVITVLPKGQIVTVVWSGLDGWAYVDVKLASGEIENGWVSSVYLKWG